AQARGRVKSLEITGDTPGLVPWQAVYDRPPGEDALWPDADDRWAAFWGRRYPLGGTHRVNPLRGADLVVRPGLLLAVDPEVRAGLSAERREQIEAFAARYSVIVVEDTEALAGALKSAVPDVLFLLTGFGEAGLRLGGQALTPERLREALGASTAAQVPWNNLLVVLQPCGQAGPGWDGLRRQVLGLRLAGLILPERPAAADTAARFTVDFAAGLLGRGEQAGVALRNAFAAS